MPQLSDMPPELLVHFTRYLSNEDIGHVRLTCKQYEAAIFKTFARQCFTKKQFMLTERSLQVLIDISKHPEFGSQVKHLVLCLDHYTDHFMGSTPLEDQGLEYLQGKGAQLALIASGAARDMLVLAMKSLVNLEVVDIRDFQQFFKSYGAAAVAQETGVSLVTHPTSGFESMPSNVFNIVVQAIGQVVDRGAQRGINIETVIRNNSWALSDAAFFLPAITRTETIVALKRIKKLHLCLDMDHATFHQKALHDPTDTKERRWMAKSHLQLFLSNTSNLEELRLNFPKSPDQNLQRAFLYWIGLPRQFSCPIHFTAPLKRLELGLVRLSSEDYAGLFRKFKDTLEAFSIWNSAVELSRQEREDKVNGWGHLFKKLAVQLPKLTEVVVGRLRIDAIWASNVEFAAKDGYKGGASIQYRGDDTAGFLTGLSDRMDVPWGNIIAESDEDMEADEEDEPYSDGDLSEEMSDDE